MTTTLATAFALITALVFVLGRLLLARRSVDSPPLNGRGVFGPLTRPFAGTLQPSDQAYEKVAADLVRAGIFHKSAAINFFATRNAAVLTWCVFVCVILALGLVETVTWKLTGVAIAVAMVIYGAPRVVLSSRAESRAKRIQHDLPDALDMITMVMSGGLTIQQAVQRVVGELQGSHPDLATELAIIHRQSEAGSFDESMKNFSHRMDVPEITALTSMMRHNNRIGGKAVDAMRDFADSVRRARQVKAEEQGNKASIKLLMPVVFFLAPPIYIMLLGPALLELKGFMSRENRPGGILQQSVQSIANPTLQTGLNQAPGRGDAGVDTAPQPLADQRSLIQRTAAQFEATRR